MPPRVGMDPAQGDPCIRARRRPRRAWTQPRPLEGAALMDRPNATDHLLLDAEGEPTRDRPWIFRTYAGHSSPRASNELYRSNLDKGQTGLSIAFDLA